MFLLTFQKKNKVCTTTRQVRQNFFILFFSFMTYHRVCNQIINTTGATSGAQTAYPSGALSSHPVFSWVRVTRSLFLCAWFVDRCLSFCTFSFGHFLSVLRYTDSDYPLGIFKLFLYRKRFGLWCIMPLSTIFQLYRGGQFY